MPPAKPTAKHGSPGLTRRAWLLGAGAGVGALVARQCAPTNHPGPPFPPADAGAAADGSVILNDASLLSPTRVASHLTIRDDQPQAAIERLRAALKEARASGRPFIASAARHSMGGQSLATNGTVATLDQQWLEPDTVAKRYRVGAGVRWSDVELDLSGGLGDLQVDGFLVYVTFTQGF